LQFLQHAIERIKWQRLVFGKAFDGRVHLLRHCGNGEKQLAALAGEQRIIGRGLLAWTAETQGAPHTGAGPGSLPGPGGEIYLFGDHPHHLTELISLNGAEMLEQGGGIGTVRPGGSIEDSLSGLGGKADHLADTVGRPRSRWRRGAAWRTEARSRDRLAG
jgi:hypothetical protein